MTPRSVYPQVRVMHAGRSHACLKIPDRADVLQGETKARGDWLVANIDATFPWVVSPETIEYRGNRFHIIPVSEQTYPAVAISVRGMRRRDAEIKLMRFISAVSWRKSSGALVARLSGGTFAMPMGRDKTRGFSICRDFELVDLPEPIDDRAALALALMREGRGLNHPGYAFLSFYRVLEVAFPKGKVRGEWLGQALNRLQGVSATDALEKLKATGIEDVGVHLYTSGRQAIAHAAGHPVIDPDDPSDMNRLRNELPIMIALAEVAIEDAFGIRTPHRLFQEHLYELDGFKTALGADLVGQVLAGTHPAEGAAINCPSIDVSLRRSRSFNALRDLEPLYAQQVEAGLVLTFGSSDRLIEFTVALDFQSERLHFDFEKGLVAHDDKTAKAARNIAELRQFVWDYIGNGELMIFDAENGQRLSRVDAFLPTNFFANTEWFCAEIEKWNRIATERDAAGKVAPPG